MTIEFRAIEFATAHEAIQWIETDGPHDKVIRLNGTYYAVEQAEADRLAAAGVEFAYIHEHQMPDGERRIVTVPIN